MLYLKKKIQKCIFSGILGIGLVCYMTQTRRAHGEMASVAWIVSGHPLIKTGKNYSL